MKALLVALREYASLVPQPGIMDIIDILVVAFVFYFIFDRIRGTAASRIAKSILLILVASWLTRILQMHALNYVLNFVLELGAFALIIIFQPELRRGLEHIGAKSVLRNRGNTWDGNDVISETVQACAEMSQKRIGVLLVFERTMPLDHYFANGTVIDARVSAQLLCNIFFPKAALHDGATIIRDGRAVAAGCVLPLTENTRLSADLGTRHRAGLGMSEASDAVVVIVSEETGTISAATSGMLKRGLTPETLQRLLQQELSTAQSASFGIVDWLRQRLHIGGGSHEA